MSQYLEYVPIALFVAVYVFAGIYWATAALMAGVTAQVLLMWMLGLQISNMLKFTLGASLIFGSLTLFLQDPLFLQWKPTIVTWAMGLALLIGQAFGRNLVQSMLGGELQMSATGWSQLNLLWGIGLLLQGAVNLYVAYNFSMDFWVAFKLAGMLALNLVLIVGTISWLIWAGHLKLPEGDPDTP